MTVNQSVPSLVRQLRVYSCIIHSAVHTSIVFIGQPERDV